MTERALPSTSTRQCAHRWTCIPPRVFALARRAGLPLPSWYAGRTVPFYCRDCGTPKES